MIEAILIYILVGVILATVLGWNEINTIFQHWDEGSVKKSEVKEFAFLMCTYVFGWGILFIMMINRAFFNEFLKKRSFYDIIMKSIDI